MDTALQPTPNHHRRVVTARALLVVFAALGASLLAGCQNLPAGGKLTTPVFRSLEVPTLTPGGWVAYPYPPRAEVLPTRGRAVRLWFDAPVGSSFGVTLKSPNGTLTPLRQNSGTPEPPETGYFQVVSEDVGKNPPRYTLLVRAPVSLADPVNYVIQVVRRSLRTDVTDSDVMEVDLIRGGCSPSPCKPVAVVA